MAISIRASGQRLLSSDEAARVDARLIGGKAAGLVRLEQLGLRVPIWVVIPAPVRLDDALLEALAEARAVLGDGDLAVRSSAVGEDGASQSFAGQFTTVLQVRGIDGLADAVRACCASASSDHVLAYHPRPMEMAVIIQRMVDADASGIVFTADPVSGDARRVRVSACRGLGDQLVSGATDGDEFVTDRAGVILESRVSDVTPSIDRATVQTLVRSAVAIADVDGPRDIEWSVADGELWFLQSRPITSALAPSIVWDNSNIQESYCGVTTPLTFSFARAAYATVYAQTMRAVGIGEPVVERHYDVLNGLLGLIHGRVYYNLNNWYRGLLLLPAFGRNKADMERMMGVDEPVDFVDDEALSWKERLSRMPAFARTVIGLLRRFATLERDTTVFLASFDALLTRVNRATIGDRSVSELKDLLRLLRREGVERWTTPIVNDFRVMMTTGAVRRLVERAVGSDVDRVMQTLLGGADVSVSSAPAMLMLRMADAAKRSPATAAALTDGAPNGLERAQAASPELAALYVELLDSYGDRCMGELKLESRSLRDDSSFVATMLTNYLRSGHRDAEALARRAAEQRTAVEGDVVGKLRVLERIRLRRALRAARTSIRAREAMRLARTRLFGVHRQIYRAIGTRLHEQRCLDDPSDVFYLTVEEIAADITDNVSEIARARRSIFDAHGERSAPNRFTTAAVPDPFAASVDVFQTLRPPVADGRVLVGLGCSPGVVEGVVRVVTGPGDDLAIDGCVLVATRTDPGWSPLFHSAAAIIVERGSVLSHSAVLARELGLPAVVGIPGVTTTLANGDRVRVDGGAGTVERLDAP